MKIVFKILAIITTGAMLSSCVIEESSYSTDYYSQDYYSTPTYTKTYYKKHRKHHNRPSNDGYSVSGGNSVPVTQPSSTSRDYYSPPANDGYSTSSGNSATVVAPAPAPASGDYISTGGNSTKVPAANDGYSSSTSVKPAEETKPVSQAPADDGYSASPGK